MSYALVGSVGAVSSGAGPITPAWGTGESRTAGNLLICWATQTAVGGNVAAPTGWSSVTTGDSETSIFYKVAAGSDAAPAVGTGFTFSAVVLAEFSGNASSSPLDQQNWGGGTTGTIVVTAPSADAASGELFVYASTANYTTSAVRTLANALNNGATAQSTNNNAISSANHYDVGFGITTGHSAADSDSFTCPTSKLSNAQATIASFKLAAAAPVTPLPTPIVSVAVTRSSVY